jgi:hypothetical protein
MEGESSGRRCLECRRDTNQTPLIALEYQGARLWICPTHIPILIHDPGRLEGKLPGAENLEPAKTGE